MNLPLKILLVACLCLLFVAARGQNRFDAPPTGEVLAQDSVYSVTQTRDGYLWIGTIVGLMRFDGVDFTVFDSINTPEIKSNLIIALHEDRQGNLWIGTEGGGLTKRTRDEFFHYPINDRLPGDFVTSLLEDANGNIWVGFQKGGVSVFRDGEFQNLSVADGLPSETVRSLVQDAASNIWIGTANGLARWQNGRFTNYSTADGLNHNQVDALRWSSTEGLLIGTKYGLNRWRDGQITKIVTETGADRARIRSILVDGGEWWIGTQENGLFHRSAGESPFKLIPEAKGIIFSIHQDSDKSILVASFITGLLKFCKRSVHYFTAEDNFPTEELRTIYETRNGDLWLSGTTPLIRFRNGKTTFYSPQQILQLNAEAMIEDAAGNLLLGGRRGISVFDGSRAVSLKPQNGFFDQAVISLLNDRAGNLWIGTLTGLYKLRDGHLTDYRNVPGLAANQILRLFADSRGTLWIGTNRGLNRMQNEQTTSLSLGDSAAQNRITAFYEDDAGALWIGTTGGGLFRYKNEKIVNVTSRDGLYDDNIYILLENNGDFWISGEKGIYRVSLQELNEFADGRRKSINSYNYGAEDGIIGRGTDSGQQTGLKTRDGMLWFATVKGAVRIDPRPLNSQPPRVFIERVKLGEETKSNVESLEVEPGNGNLEIKYTAISWQRAKRVKFRYRMNGLDADWTDAGVRRTAFYPYLPPGEYTFQVIADNGDGVWNETGKSLSIRVLPPFYRTWWFFALTGLAVALLGVWFYKFRVAQLERKQAQQEEFSRRLINAHESERRRIAAELHDSIGQSLALIKNRAVLGAESATDENARKQLELIDSQTSQTISEVREISYNLRPYLLDNLGLTKAIKSLLNKISETSQFTIKTEIDQIDNLFDPEAEMSIYRIVQESLSNVGKHAAATEVSVMLKKGTRSLSIIIADDGKGFDAHKTQTTDFDKGGFGLLGISERVRYLGGTQEIETAIGAGTTVFIRIPLTATKNSKTNGQTV